MLKKAGIIAAAATAGVLALSPLAFAGEGGDNGKNHHDEKDKNHSHVERKHDDDDNRRNGDEVNVSGDQTCNTAGAQGNDVSGEQSGAVSLLGGIALGLPVQVQAPILNCADFSNDDVRVVERETTVEDNRFER